MNVFLHLIEHWQRYTVLYIVIGLLTFGVIINHVECRQYSTFEDCTGRNVGAFFGAAFWPLTIAGRVAISLTSWP